MLLEIANLKTSFRRDDGGTARAVDGISFTITAGETLALVGESGCGKSVTAFSILRLLPETANHPAGAIRFAGRDLLTLPEPEMAAIRGDRIAMIFQEPMTSLNPLLRIGVQLMEPLRQHRGLAPAAAAAEAVRLLRRVGIPGAEQRLRDWPHQLSGGMRQRVMIAMALACRPELLIADEPTTALDVTIQAQILNLMKDLQAETGMAMLFITHDLGIVNQIADRVCVMYAGRIVEQGTREQLFQKMRHPYTRGLFASLPHGSCRDAILPAIPGAVPSADAVPPAGCRFRDRCASAQPICAEQEPPSQSTPDGHLACCHFADSAPPPPPTAPPPPAPKPGADSATAPPLLEVEALQTWFPLRRGLLGRVHAHVKAVDGVSLALRPGHTLALVGESGCGKTTVGLSVLRLLREARGRVVFQGVSVPDLDRRALRALRRQMQIVFQDPFSSLSPRLTVAEIVGEGLRVHEPALDAAGRRARVVRALAEVGLDATALPRYPHEFSGGQRQRLSLARALVLQPAFLVLDEPTSALDVSVQAQILNLLARLQAAHGLAYLLITHNLAVVEYLADDVAVMYLGRIVEAGPAAAVLRSPQHPYTRLLLDAVPRVEERRPLARLEGEVPSPLQPPAGCHFHPRCPRYAGAGADAGWRERCPASYPVAVEAVAGHRVACHAVAAGG
ncbi:MAG: dipeptide ABC transporter ATP-binding protein [Lentisphaeria bacterium]|jgi:peptide/nickel transport system ATP-binding protein